MKPMHWTVCRSLLLQLLALSFCAADDTIHEMVEWGRPEALRERLIDQPHLVKLRNAAGGTPLHVAAMHNRADMATVLLVFGADINSKHAASGETPLHIAARHGHREVCLVLLGNGAEVNAADDIGLTALHKACSMGKAQIAELLLANGADPNAKSDSGARPLHVAVASGSKATVETLLRFKSQVNPRDDLFLTPLAFAKQAKAEDLAHLLQQHGGVEDPRASGQGRSESQDPISGETDIHGLARSGSREELLALLAKPKTDVNLPRNDGATPLHIAAKSANHTALKVLLAAGANREARTEEGETPLHWAVRAGDLKAVELLLQMKANPHAQNEQGKTALHFAAERGQAAIAKLLLEHKVNPNCQDRMGETPLLLAVEEGHHETVLTMLQCEADPTIENLQGESSLEIASEKGLKAISQTLSAKTKDVEAYVEESEIFRTAYAGDVEKADKLLADNPELVSARNKDGQTPLHIAASLGHLKLADMLLAHGADCNARDNKTRTAIELAAKNQHEEIVQLLRRYGAVELEHHQGNDGR